MKLMVVEDEEGTLLTLPRPGDTWKINLNSNARPKVINTKPM
jgi:hypothetical protein